MKLIIIGGGWAGVSAAVAAKKAGADVVLIEKTDLLLGNGNAGGIMRNNGRFTAAEELIALGCEDIFQIIDNCATHKNIDFPGHKHATLYSTILIEGRIRAYLISLGICLKMESRVADVEFKKGKISAIILDNQERIEGDVFIEATGSSGPMGNCLKYGNGCAMCVLRCPTFGPRISISAKCGLKDYQGTRQDDSYGVFSGSCELHKDSLSSELQEALNKNGLLILKVPTEDVNYEKLTAKACKQYALKEFSENIVLLDTGNVKLMASYYPLEKLRKINGLENAKYAAPLGGSKGNSVRYLSLALRSNDMRVKGVCNLFCAGEKSGLFVGHTEAIATGALAGHNAVKYALNVPLLTLPDSLAVGDIISFANYKVQEENDTKERLTFAGGTFFERMKEKNLYSTDAKEIEERVKKAGLWGIFNQRQC